MKYKRLLVFVTSMIFFTALVICFFAMFKTAEIYVDVNAVSGSNEQVADKVQALLEDKEGKNLLFISTEEIEREINGASSYAKVSKIVKKYPNKLEVYVEERVEKFAIYYGDKYYALDNEFHVLSESDKNANNIDEKPNLLINFDIADVDKTVLIDVISALTSGAYTFDITETTITVEGGTVSEEPVEEETFDEDAYLDDALAQM